MVCGINRVKQFISILLCLCLLTGMASGEVYNVKTVTGMAQVLIEDEWFSASSYIYNHELMRSMLAISMTGWGTGAHYGETGDFGREINSQNAAEQLGFEGFRAYNYDVSLNDASSYSAYYIANRRLTTGRTLVICVARCYDYGCGFADNFCVGSDGIHQGFNAAGTEMASSIAEYVRENLAGEDVCLLLTGYSRAAAVANTAAKQLDDMAAAGEIAISPESIYTYAFAVPATVIKGCEGEGDPLYANIRSIVGYLDIVPEAPLTGWGFTRYGITYTFASSGEVPETVTESFEKLTGYSLDTDGKRDKIVNTLNSMLRMIPSAEDYAMKWQSLFVLYLNAVYGKVNRGAVDESLIGTVREKYQATAWGAYILKEYDALTDKWVSSPVLTLLMLRGAEALEAVRSSAAVASLAKGMGDESYSALLAYLAASRLASGEVSKATGEPEILLRAEYLPMLSVFAGFMECFEGHDFPYYKAYLYTLSGGEAFN